MKLRMRFWGWWRKAEKVMESKIVEISRKVLDRLCAMGCEGHDLVSDERLIYPVKTGKEKRISEQELRFLFVKTFLEDENFDGYCYSVETPTEIKYSFGKKIEDIKVGIGKSGSIDMSLFEKNSNLLNRLFNIEFKFDNVPLQNFAKDIVKLMHEKESGAFILLLENTEINKTLNSVYSKFSTSLDTHKKKWRGEKNKSILLVLLSLEIETNKNKVAFIKYRKVIESDLETIKSNIQNGWIYN